MPDSTSSPGQGEANTLPLDEALNKNKEATAEVKRAADELAVVHAVLDTKIAQGECDADVKRAVEETDRLEKRLGDSADKLDQVNQTLQRQVGGTH